MNVFEDLIEELKDENLIEETVMDINRSSFENQEEQPSEAIQKMISEEPENAASEEMPQEVAAHEASIVHAGEPLIREDNAEGSVYNENDFYRRRAMEEVSSLQMVERIFSGVEREQVKILPKAYDDISVSKALHDFLQVSKGGNSPENAAAEFKLMQETESWYSALSHRDQNILPAQLRRYCETTRPVLSSQALVALARFYRNSAFSEIVRTKFEMIITRLFTQDIDGEKRDLPFEHSELVQHLSELYADWSSIPLYAGEDDSELSIIALKFEDFITEAEIVSDFEQFVTSDFFSRLRAFKESTGEKFYAPEVTATAIKCNIRIGNRYVELLNSERRKNNAAKLEDKYNYLLDQTVSEAASKTLQLVKLLSEKTFENNQKAEEEEKTEKIKIQEPQTTVVVKKEPKISSGLFSVNKWLLALTIVVIAATGMLYTWVEMVTPQPSTAGVQTVNLEGYYFKDYLKVAKLTDETLIGVVNANWADLSDEKKQEMLKNFLAVGKDKGFKRIQLLNNEGKTIGYASPTSVNAGNSNSNPAQK